MDQYSDQNRRKSQDAFDGAGGSLNRGPETQGRFVWRDCVRELTRSEPRQNLERWFRPLRYIVEQDGKALIGARMPYTFSQITPALQAKISQTWSKTDPLSRPVEFVCWAELSPSVRELVNDPWAVEPDLEVDADESASSKDETGYNVVSPSVMRFDTLVTGPSNSLAAVTCQRIADEQPVAGTIFVLCGSQGVGKTHMMRAVEAKLAATGRRRVTYISAEEFYVAYAEGARNHNTLELKERVRTADVVLFDDLQIVAGKKGTNTELAGAMRTVSERGGIFVLTTSVPHAELKGLSNEVHTVLRGAVDIEVREPDDAMRRKIVRERAEMLQAQSPGFVLSDSLVDELVERVDGTGRDLCGLLLSLYTETTYGETPLTAELLDDVIRRKQGQRAVTLDAIKRAVCRELSITRSDLEGSRRFKPLVNARGIGMYLSRLMTEKSYPQIALAYGKKDHTTVMHNVRKITKALKEDAELGRDVERVRRAAMRFASGRSV